MISKRVFLDHSLEDLCINSFVHNAPFLYPQKHQKTLMFSDVSKVHWE